MTLERASELVAACNGQEQIDLFDFFVTYFRIDTNDAEAMYRFASMCGFLCCSMKESWEG